MTEQTRISLAARIKNAVVVSVMEQYENPGPLWAQPLSKMEVALIVKSLLAPEPRS